MANGWTIAEGHGHARGGCGCHQLQLSSELGASGVPLTPDRRAVAAVPAKEMHQVYDLMDGMHVLISDEDSFGAPTK
eukprot:g26240.t1